MLRFPLAPFVGVALLALSTAPALAESRVALVLGTAAYTGGAPPTALNDAGLVSSTLRELGFSIVDGADLSLAETREAFSNFLAKVREAGPDTIALVYVAGLGLTHEGDGYLIPAEAAISGEADVPINGLRLVDLTRAIGAAPAKARLALFDLSRTHALTAMGAPVRAGLPALDAGPGMLIASAAAPGQTSTLTGAAYGRFALALAEHLRAPGLPLDEAIARARLRVHQETNGRDTPWQISTLTQPVPALTEASASAPAPQRLADQPIAGRPAQEAYALAVERDTIAGYQEFLRAFPNDPLAARVKRLLAAKREEVVWRQSRRMATREAYWTYVKRYPDGPNAEFARGRLSQMQAPLLPPPDFVEVDYIDIPPPLPVLEVYDPVYWAPPPPIFYDEVPIVSAVVIGPPPAPLWALAPPPPTYGYLPYVAAGALAVGAAAIILPRALLRPAPPTVVVPYSAMRRFGPGAAPTPVGLPPGARVLPGSGPTRRPAGAIAPTSLPGGAPAIAPPRALPGAPGGSALPMPPAGPANSRLAPGSQGPGQRFVPTGPATRRVGPTGAGAPGDARRGRVVDPSTIQSGRRGPPNAGRRLRETPGVVTRGQPPVDRGFAPRAPQPRIGASGPPGGFRQTLPPVRQAAPPRIQAAPRVQAAPRIQASPRMQAPPRVQAPQTRAPTQQRQRRPGER